MSELLTLLSLLFYIDVLACFLLASNQESCPPPPPPPPLLNCVCITQFVHPHQSAHTYKQNTWHQGMQTYNHINRMSQFYFS